MVEVTTEKIKYFRKEPEIEWKWNNFRGFSLLFDNPANSLSKMKDNIFINDVNLKSKKLELYKKIYSSLRNTNLDLLINRYYFCPLPYSSYHVTVWDGLNYYNLNKIDKKYKSDLKNFLNNLPDSFLKDQIFIKKAKEADLTDQKWNIKFRVDKLVKGSTTLVIRLEPEETSDHEKLTKLKRERKKLYDIYQDFFKVDLHWEYSPHINLGYFSNKNKAQNIDSHINNLERNILNNTKDTSICFPTISLYGYTDMKTFFKGN